jgi:predicted secreted protein
MLWVALSKMWTVWRSVLVIVKPETVIASSRVNQGTCVSGVTPSGPRCSRSSRRVLGAKATGAVRWGPAPFCYQIAALREIRGLRPETATPRCISQPRQSSTLPGIAGTIPTLRGTRPSKTSVVRLGWNTCNPPRTCDQRVWTLSPNRSRLPQC